MTRRLIIHADDFGETAEITSGIEDGIDAGVVTSTTVLANMPGTVDALPKAAQRGRTTSFGVHLNLCEGPSLTQAPSLTGADGRFLPKRTQAVRAILGRMNLGELEAELRAQISLVRDAGVQISHLDSHKHLHQLPGVAGVVARLAREFGVERIRCTLEEGVMVAGMGPVRTLQRLARRRLASSASRTFSAAGLRHPGRTFDVRQLMATHGSEARTGLLAGLTELTEMVCHPGTEQADLEKPGSCHRHEELEFLRSTEFRRLLDSTGIRLVTYWEC